MAFGCFALLQRRCFHPRHVALARRALVRRAGLQQQMPAITLAERSRSVVGQISGVLPLFRNRVNARRPQQRARRLRLRLKILNRN